MGSVLPFPWLAQEYDDAYSSRTSQPWPSDARPPRDMLWSLSEETDAEK